jgi:hypothetical protein
MSMPPPPPQAQGGGPINPLEAMINSANTNTYLIGLSMILLNLGGRHLAPSLTGEQDKFFQAQWVRRAMLFVVVFVATRNIFTALWLSVGLILIIGYLLNEHSQLYLFGEPQPLPENASAPPTVGLTPEEQEIYKRLHDKANRNASADQLKRKEKKEDPASNMLAWYKENMGALQQIIN